MKFKKLLIVAVLLQLFSVSYFGQDAEPVLHDVFSYGNREDMMARIDNYANALQDNPAATGYIIINGSKTHRAKTEKEIKNYIKMRRLESSRFVFLDGNDDKTTEIALWSVPPGAKPPAPVKIADKKESVESQIIALEKASWAAWKKKDGSWFENNLADDWLLVNSFETETKKEIIGGIATDCEVESFSLDNFKFAMLTKDSARLTYKAQQDAVCEGNTLPKNVRSTAVYVRRGGKWLQSLYMEMQLIQ